MTERMNKDKVDKLLLGIIKSASLQAYSHKTAIMDFKPLPVYIIYVHVYMYYVL